MYIICQRNPTIKMINRERRFTRCLPYFLCISIVFLVIVKLYLEKENEGSVAGFYVCNFFKLRYFRNCKVFSIGVKRNLKFESEIRRVTRGSCEIHAFAEKLDDRLEHDARLRKIPIQALADVHLASSNNSALALNELLNREIGDDHYVALMKFEDGNRAVDLVTSRMLNRYICQVLLSVKVRSKAEIYKIITVMGKSQYYLGAAELQRQWFPSKSSNGTARRRYRDRYNLTYFSLMCENNLKQCRK